MSSRILCSAVGVMVIMASPFLVLVCLRTLVDTGRPTRAFLFDGIEEVAVSMHTTAIRVPGRTSGVGSGEDRGINRAGRKADARRIGQSAWLCTFSTRLSAIGTGVKHY